MSGTPSSSCTWATSSASAAAIRAAATRGSIDRLGADIGLRCETCGRHLLLERARPRAPHRRLRPPRRPRAQRRRRSARPDDRRAAGGGRARDVAAIPRGPDEPDETSVLAVFRNRPFLLLWLSQAFTQIGGNMVIYGLTVIILEATRSNTAVSILILTFLGPAVLFSAVAGVYVDRLDKRVVLVVTNVLRSLAFVVLYLVGRQPGADPRAQRRRSRRSRCSSGRPRRR